MSSYLSLLGVSTIDNVVGNNVNVQNVTTNSVTVSTLNAGLVSATSGGTLQNATVGTGLSFTGNTLNNTGVTSIVSGATGPVYISQSSTGSVEIALPQNLSVASSPNFTNLGVQNYLIVGSTSNVNSLLAASAGFVVNAISDPPLSYDNTTSRYSIALTGSTGIDYSVIGNTGYITNKFMTGPTGPIGPTGAGGTIGYYANYYSTTTQSIGSSAQQITFPNNFVENGISLDVNNNITFNHPGTYKISTTLQVNGSNNAKFYHWYRFNGSDVANSAYEDHFSSGAGQVLSTSSGLITVVAGDKLGIWGVKTAGTINVTYTTGSVSPVYPASTSVNVVVSQETYTQIGPTGYTGPQSLITSNFNVFGGVNAGISRTTATGNVGIGYNALSSLTDSLNNVAVGTDALKVLTTTEVQGSNTAVGFASLSQCSTGYRNTCIGSGSGRAVVSGRQNTALGMSSALNLTSGDNNVIIGAFSGGNILRANDNISIGNFSMSKGTSFMTGPDGRNIALGYYAGHSLSGYPTNNVAIGYQALWNAGQVSDNIAIGTNSLASVVNGGGGNIAVGGSSTSVGGTLTNGQGYNIGVGIASNLYLSANASNNIGIGAYSNFNTSTGINNISIGPFTQALSATGCNNIVLSTNGTISVPVSAKGDNTAFIDSRSGLYYYNPAICYLYSTGLSNGRVQWDTYDTNNVPTKGFYFADYGNGANTVIVPNVYGHYEITINGAMLGNGSNLTLTMNNVNIRNYSLWYQSFSTNGIAYSLSATAFARPYTTVNLSGFEFELTNMTLWGGLPLFVCIKFIGF
jgi:hypothetical protein